MKLNSKRTFIIGLAFFSICAFWQMYDNIVPLILKYRYGISDSLVLLYTTLRLKNQERKAAG